MRGSNSDPPEVKTILTGIIALVLIAFGSIVMLTLANRSVDAVVTMISTIIAPTIVALLAYQRMESMEGKIDSIRRSMGGQTLPPYHRREHKE